MAALPGALTAELRGILAALMGALTAALMGALTAALLSCAHVQHGPPPASRPPATGAASGDTLPGDAARGVSPTRPPDSLAATPPSATPPSMSADTTSGMSSTAPDSAGPSSSPAVTDRAAALDSSRIGHAGIRHEHTDDLFGRLTTRGAYEVRSLASDAVLGREDWELFEDDAGRRTLRAVSELDVDGSRTSRSATLTVTPELSFVEADLGSTAAGMDSYATYRRSGDLLQVEAHGDASGETRQQVRFPEDGVFVSQLFAARGWELAAFERSEEATRPAYLAGSAPGVLLGEVRTLSARRVAQEDLRLEVGSFRTWRFEVPLSAEPAGVPRSGDDDAIVDRWWVTAGSRLPVAADLPSLGVRLELVDLEQSSAAAAPTAPGPVLARGMYQHRLLRRTEPIGTESWTLSASAEGGYILDSELVYADGSRMAVRAAADSVFRVREVQLRRSSGRGGESGSIRVGERELRAEARGGPVGMAEQSLPLEGPVVFRLSAAALEGWAEVVAGEAARVRSETPSNAGTPAESTGAPGDSMGSPTDSSGGTPSDSSRRTSANSIGGTPAGASGPTLTYWLPPGPHPLGTLVRLPPDVDLGEERLPTPARTFATRRYASPADTPPLFRTVRWLFGPYRLPARVLFPALGREAILVRYESGAASE